MSSPNAWRKRIHIDRFRLSPEVRRIANDMISDWSNREAASVLLLEDWVKAAQVPAQDSVGMAELIVRSEKLLKGD